MWRWLVSSDTYRRCFWKRSIMVPHDLTCQQISCIIQPYGENLALSPGFYTRLFSVFCDLWLFKVSGQKTHWFLASASQRFLLWLTAPAFISQFIHLICVIQGIFFAVVYFGFALLVFSLRGTSTIVSPPCSSGIRLCFTFFPGLQSQWIAMVWAQERCF